MTIKVRALLVTGLVMATIWMVGCGHYTCGITFGNSSCTASGGGISQGGGNTPTGDAFVYIADPGEIQGFTFTKSSGTFADNCTPTTCPQGLPSLNVGTEEWALAPQSKFLYVGYATSPSIIYEWGIGTDGILTNGASSVYPFTFPFTVSGVGGQAMITNPTGTMLFVIDPTAGNAAIHVYQIGTSGGLTEIGVGTLLPSGFQPYNLAIDGLGKYLYVSNVVGSNTTQIMAYSIANGVLSTVTGSPFSSNLIQMQGDSTGQFMVGTTSTIANNDPNLYVMTITQTGANAGAPTLLGSIATVHPPAGVAVQPSSGGTLVYSFSITGAGIGGPVEGYTINTSTGALAPISGFAFQAGGDAIQFDQAGKFLFARDLFGKIMVIYDVSDPTLANSVGSGVWEQNPWAWVATDIP
jgi:6-phosphogluconolactonase (cycloisomerase 2 family)